jgi:hypothetical protein
MSELRFFGADGLLLTPVSVTPMPGATFNDGQAPDKLFDGVIEAENKFCDQSIIKPGSVYFSFAQPVQVRSYEWVTGEDMPGRDPISWSVKRRLDTDSEWTLMHNVSQAAVTTDRNAVVGPYQNFSDSLGCKPDNFVCVLCEAGKYKSSVGNAPCVLA